MQVGVGLPTGVPGTDADLIVRWARQADAGPFASLGVLDRIIYDSIDPIVGLSAAAAVTERIELVTSILISPLRETSTLAKQLASLAALAPGRLTVGTAIGARGDDYEANEFSKGNRGRRLTEQLAQLRTLDGDGIGAPGFEPPLRLLVGGTSGPAYARVAQLADGWIHNGSPPKIFRRQLDDARAAWADAGRPGQPEVWSMAYVGLGDAAEAGRDYLLDYYAFTGAFARRIADGLLTTPLQVREYVRAYEDAGCDHLILFPTVPEIEQLDLLAEVVGDRRPAAQSPTR
jgi:alkanesulfonate monooxygenase SsuD/methylene tetrahydromethanopterin reductase-like flavin-dependent oxidoreductase (luciferase family)